MPKRIPLPVEKKLMAEAAQKSHGSIEFLQAPQGFDKNLAWELANLVRIAYVDYERFDHDHDGDDLIQEHDSIWLPAEANTGLADHFWLKHAKGNQEDTNSSSIKDAIHYKVLAVFTYLAFNLGLPPVPEVDRFGLILERDSTAKASNSSTSSPKTKELYMIFRGTMEPAEWFNDFQFKQIPYLTPDKHFSGLGEVCLGFNKIYTDYRPGVAMNKTVLNKFSRWIDEEVRAKVMAEHLSLCQLHKLSIKDTVHQVLGALIATDSTPLRIHVAGHSLGAALATLSALHAAFLCKQQNPHYPVDLYTFASPRVGDSQFVQACTQHLNAFRIANSEDVVPGLPPATLKVVGEEMNPSPQVAAARKALAAVSGGVSEDVFEHVGLPVYFTTQLGEISSNHNMGHTYCAALQAMRPPSP